VKSAQKGLAAEHALSARNCLIASYLTENQFHLAWQLWRRSYRRRCLLRRVQISVTNEGRRNRSERQDNGRAIDASRATRSSPDNGNFRCVVACAPIAFPPTNGYARVPEK